MSGGSPGRQARALIRAADRVSLATALADGGWPYASLALAACDHDGTPILLLSDLADHSRNIARDARVSLLYDGTAGLAEPLAGPRLTVLGRAQRSDAPQARARYLARHASAAQYADFADFAFYRVAVERAHLVAGFGQIEWIEAKDLLYDVSGAAALGPAEAGILAHMNADHAEALDLYARVLIGRAGEGWRMTGIDPEGCDLAREGAVARLDFAVEAADAKAARAELVRLVGEARRREAGERGGQRGAASS